MTLNAPTEKVERFEDHVNATIAEIVQWSNNPALSSSDMLEIRFVAESGATFKKIIFAKDKLVGADKASACIQASLEVARKHFGEIAKVVTSGSKIVMPKLSYNRGNHFARPISETNGDVAGVDRGLRLLEGGVGSAKVDESSLLAQLEKRPEELKKAMLERLRTRRGVLFGSGLITPRDSQVEALDRFEEFLADEKNESLKGYIVQPTGTGKTVLFGLLLKLVGLPGLILVPDSNLLVQIKEELVRVLQVDQDEIGLLDGSHQEFGRKFTIATYAMHNSLSRSRNRNYRKLMSKISLMICDEAHDALGERTVKRMNDFEAKEGFVRIGFTATPALISKHVEEYFGPEISNTSFSVEVDRGVLVPMKLVEIGASIVGKELNGTNISEANETRIVEREHIFERTLQEYLKLKAEQEELGKKLYTAVYLNRIAHAHRYAEMAKAEGLKVEVVASDDGEVSEELRRRIKRIETDLLEGKLDMVIAVDRMAQGWNFVPLNCVVLAAPMVSPKKIIQRVGRGARSMEGKECFYVIAPNFKVQMPRRRNNKVKKLEWEMEERAERTDRNAYKLGDNISVIDSLKAFGESDESLEKVCTVIGRNEFFKPSVAKVPSIFRKLLPSDFPVEYFDNYLTQPERVRTDLQNLADRHDLPGIEYLRIPCFTGRMALADGIELPADDYLILTAHLIGSKTRISEGLWSLKKLVSCEALPWTDPAYFTPQRVAEDLKIAKRQKSALLTEYFKFISAMLYDEQERPLQGLTYLTKAKRLFPVPPTMRNAQFFEEVLVPYSKGKLFMQLRKPEVVEKVNGVQQVVKPGPVQEVTAVVTEVRAEEAVAAVEEEPATDTSSNVPQVGEVSEVSVEEPIAIDRTVPQVSETIGEPAVVVDESTGREVSEGEKVSEVINEVVEISQPDAVNQIGVWMKEVLAKFSDDQLRVAEAILVEGKSVKEIAAEFSIPMGKVMMISAKVKMLVAEQVE